MNKYVFSTQKGKAYYCNSIPDFIKDDSSSIVGQLVRHSFEINKDQSDAWDNQIRELQERLEKSDMDGDIIFEYVINKSHEEPTKKLIRIGQIGLGRQGERIYSIFGQSTTLSSQGGGLGGKTGMYLIDGKVRKLYPRECARLMGFPDDFKLASTQERCYNQFGNSVIVDVLQYILLRIISKIQEE